MIKFYRGLREKYNATTHSDGIYFATDTKEILTSDASYGKNNDNSLTTLDIVVAGGPLAKVLNDWPTDEDWNVDGNKVIPQGTSTQELLEKLFLKPVDGSVSWGTISWDPKLGNPTVTLSSNGPVEIGSTVTCTVSANSSVTGNTRSAVCTTDQGYFDTIEGSHHSGNKTVSVNGSASGTVSVSYKWNGTTVANFESGSTALKIKSGENKFIASQSGITASVEALPETTVYASTNTKLVLSNKSAKLTDSATALLRTVDLDSSANDTITGYYRWSAFAADSIDISKTESSWNFTNSKSISSVTAADLKYIIVMVPSGFTLKTATQMNLDFKGSFATKDVDIKIGGGDDTHTYKMYYWQNTSGSDAKVESITIL